LRDQSDRSADEPFGLWLLPGFHTSNSDNSGTINSSLPHLTFRVADDSLTATFLGIYQGRHVTIGAHGTFRAYSTMRSREMATNAEEKSSTIDDSALLAKLGIVDILIDSTR
jgi:hypothetical protein